MGFAGLHIGDLKRSFARVRIEADVIEDDSAGDHCVIRLVNMRYPPAEALLYYENQGIEPRLALLKFGSIEAEEDKSLGSTLRALIGKKQDETLRLVGRRGDDISRIVEWVAAKYECSEIASHP